MAALVNLGAMIDRGFTQTELRSAYRALALEYHPDRHAETAPHERGRLSQVFVDIADHYRCLLTAVDADAATAIES